MVTLVKEILGPRGSYGNWISLMLCVISASLDPLLFYIPVINRHKHCMDLDKKLGIIYCVLRSVIDLIYMVNIRFQPHTDSSAPHDLPSSPYGSQKGYILDLLAVVPLPQVMIIIFVSSKVSNFLNAMNVLKYFVYFQFVPRAGRIYPLSRKAKKTLGIVAEVTLAKAAFNLYLYIVCGHVFGALWYFFAIDSEIKCWKKACRAINQSTGCNNQSFGCHKSSRDYSFLDDFCSTKSQSRAFYDFGIYHTALDSGVAEGSFLPKFIYSFRWGLQSLSCFAQNLVPSIDIGENMFTITITVASVVLFIFLIGNMQLYLQSRSTRSEDMKLKIRDIEQWTPFKKLSENLRQQVKKYQQHVWQETKGVDVENILNNMPKHLSRNIKRELCLHSIEKVRMFENMDGQLLDATCDRLKPVLYTKDSYIVRGGDPVDEMLFIMRGTLLTMKINGCTTGFFDSEYLGAGDFCGEGLVTWALDPHTSSNPPISTRTVRALVEVEAFALKAGDLKFVASQFRRRHSKQALHTFRFYSQQWRTWAACFLQAAWRRYSKKKLEESLRAEESRLQDALANAGGTSLSLGATIYASRFAANALRALRRNSTQKAKPERVLPTLLLKPAELDFTSEEQ